MNPSQYTDTQIDDIIGSFDYAPLFSFNKTDLQIYFDDKCQNADIAKVDLMLTLFPQMEISNALIFAYRNNMRDLFALLCSKIPRNPISSNKNIARMIIDDCYEFAGRNPNECIHPILLAELVNLKLCDCDQLLIISANIRNNDLAQMTFEAASETAKLDAFRISYLNGYYPIAKLCYDYIRCSRAEVAELFEYCPSGEIIRMVAFQEFYNWQTQLKHSVDNRNHYAVESLFKKMPRHTTIEFAIIADMLESATDELLSVLCTKFLMRDIDKKIVYLTMRKPILDFIETRTSDWLVV
jgi:hypothetical protein